MYCVYSPTAMFRKVKDTAEDAVSGSVGTRSLPPSLDDSPVVPVDREVLTLARNGA